MKSSFNTWLNSIAVEAEASKLISSLLQTLNSIAFITLVVEPKILAAMYIVSEIEVVVSIVIADLGLKLVTTSPEVNGMVAKRSENCAYYPVLH